METATMEPKKAKPERAAAPGLQPLIHPWAKQELPLGTLEIHTYKELRLMVKKWATGELDDTLVIIGAAGVGKSETARAALEEVSHCYLKGQATKYGVYLKLIAHQDQPVVLDDVDTLLQSKEVTGLLKMLLETRTPRLIQWTTANTLHADSDIPASFLTKSRTMILANELSQVSKNFKAVLDRCTILWFAPDADEVHRYAGSWFKDKEVYAYVGERLKVCAAPSCRYYYHGKKWKAAGLGWQKMLDQMMLPPESRATLIRELEARYENGKDRVAEWKRVTGQTEQTYWAVKRAVDIKHGKRSSRGMLISEAMKRKHAERKTREGGA